MILDGMVDIEEVDISAPGMEEARDFMRANGKKKDGERHVLPPQIFNGDKYCGVISHFSNMLCTVWSMFPFVAKYR